MVELLEKAIAKVSKTPTEEQERFTAWMLEELEAEERWQKSFEASPDILGRMADEARAEFLRGESNYS